MAETESNSTTSNRPSKREPGRYLVPFRWELNRDNGHITWWCRIEEVDENGNVMQGPIQAHGTDTPALNRFHKGDHRNFLLNEVKPKMMKHYEDWIQDHADAEQLKGVSL